MQGSSLDGGSDWIEPDPFNRFIEGSNQAGDVDPVQAAFAGYLHVPPNLGAFPSFALNSYASTRHSINAYTVNAVSSSRDRAYTTPGDTLHSLSGSQWGADGSGSVPSAPHVYHAPVLPNFGHSIVEPVSLAYVNPYGGLGESDAFLGSWNRWESSPPLNLAPCGEPQGQEASYVSTCGQNSQDATAEQTEIRQQIDSHLRDRAFPSFVDLQGTDVFLQGNKPYQTSDHADITHNVRLGQVSLGAMPNLEDHSSQNPKTTYPNASAPILNSVPSRKVTKARRQQKPPTADPASVIKKPKPRKRKATSDDRRQDVALSREVRACFRCRVAKVRCLSFRLRIA